MAFSPIKWLKSLFQNVSIEPALFVFSFVMFLYNAAMPNLIQQKVCSPDTQPPTDFICDDPDLLAEATDIVSVRATLKKTLPIIILFLAGFWRDSTGLNKPPIYLSILCEIAGVCVQMYAYFYWTSSPWITSIIEGIINGLGGSSSLFYVGGSWTIADNTAVGDRTTRLTIISAGISIGVCLGYAVFGYAVSYMGYQWFFIFTISLYLAAGALVMIFVKDKKIKKKEISMCKSLKQLKTAFKRSPNIIVTWFMVLASCMITVLVLAELNVYQYYLQQGFGYSIDEAGLYTAYRTMVRSVGCFTLSPILVKVMKWSDYKIGIVCSLIIAISCLSMVFAATTLEIMLFALLDLPKGILFGVPKSIISKYVNQDEIGMFFSFCYMGECILPIVINYIYGYIYTATFTILPGAFYLASTAIVTIMLIFYSISPCIYTPIETHDKKTNNVPEDLENCEQVSQCAS